MLRLTNPESLSIITPRAVQIAPLPRAHPRSSRFEHSSPRELYSSAFETSFIRLKLHVITVTITRSKVSDEHYLPPIRACLSGRNFDFRILLPVIKPSQALPIACLALCLRLGYISLQLFPNRSKGRCRIHG